MIGKNTLVLNQDTLCEALENWLNALVFTNSHQVEVNEVSINEDEPVLLDEIHVIFTVARNPNTEKKEDSE